MRKYEEQKSILVCSFVKFSDVYRSDMVVDMGYYVLSVSWTVSSIERRFFKLNVSLSSDTDDIENDMNELFQLLSNGK